MVLFGEKLISIYASVVQMGMRKFNIVGYSYGILGILNILSGLLRGMDASFINMVTSVLHSIMFIWVFKKEKRRFEAVSTVKSETNIPLSVTI